MEKNKEKRCFKECKVRKMNCNCFFASIMSQHPWPKHLWRELRGGRLADVELLEEAVAIAGVERTPVLLHQQAVLQRLRLGDGRVPEE